MIPAKWISFFHLGRKSTWILLLFWCAKSLLEQKLYNLKFLFLLQAAVKNMQDITDFV